MNNQIFRKKSIDSISSPEQLNDYIRVSNPGVWMVLTAVILLLLGVCVWGVLGRLDTRLSVAGIVKDNRLTCYIKEEDRDSVDVGMAVSAGEKSFSIEEISREPVQLPLETGDYVLYAGGLLPEEWVYCAYADVSLEDGVYKAEITTESIAPISFIWN